MSNQINSHEVRRIILQQSKRARVGHIGSALSVSDILVALYGHILKISDPDDPDRDRFILSNGHAALGLYAVLHLRGWISEDELNSYGGNHTLLGVHPDANLRGVDFSTGSLGQGLSIGAGAALAARQQSSARRVFVLISDAECNEGSIWEAAMFAAHHKLSNLIVILDLNGQQALGYTKDVLELNSMVDRWRAFGWNVIEADGHRIAEFVEAVNSISPQLMQPHIFIAHTTFGKGVSFMENQIKWHYWPMSDAEYIQALDELEALK